MSEIARISVSVPQDLLARLDSYRAPRLVPRSRLVAKAIEELLDREESDGG